MDDDLFRRDYDSSHAEKDNLFAWTVVILLLIGAAFAVWLGGYYIFGHPENPKSHAILVKLKKIEPPKRFVVTAAPQGEFLTPEKLYDKYALYTRLELKRENDLLMRDYLKNYRETKKLVPYIIGKYKIVDSFELKDSDLFPSGVVSIAVPEDYPRVLLEQVYPANRANVPVLDDMLQRGLGIKLERSTDLSAVIHIERLEDGRLMFTAVPLLYGSYAPKDGQGGFSLEPPTELNLASGAPLVKEQVVLDSLKQFAAAQRGRDSGVPGMTSRTTAQATPTPEPAVPQLFRVEPSPTPAATAAPVATPAIAQATPTPKESATPIELAQNTTPTPPPTPSPQPTAPSGVPLQPFLVPRTTPGISSGGTWPVYAPGRMPRGRLVDLDDVRDMPASGVEGDRVYLQGDFVVTAAGGNRAVLRSRRNASAARIMVEFPSGAFPPREGEAVSRDNQRPFLIRQVRRGEDGELTIYVREVTAAAP